MLARRVVVATDGSDNSIRALEQTQTLVHGHGHLVAVVHVMTEEAPLTDSFNEQLTPEDPVGRGHRILSDACHILGLPDTEVEQILTRGHPAEEVLKAAVKFRADLIVVGCRGNSHWKGSRFGSVSLAVVKDAPCSVLVIKDQHQHSFSPG